MEAPFIQTNVCLKFTGASKLGNVTLFECQLSICDPGRVMRTCEWQQVMILHNYFYTTSILLHLIQTLSSSSEEICC